MEEYLMLEHINEGRTGGFEYAVFDFDGTLSLIREGWQQIMVPYFIDELSKAPGAKNLTEEEISYKVRDFVTVLTGKQTIYQCIRLAEEITALGGTPEDPQVYKDEYQNRLLVHIDNRLKGLADGTLEAEPLTVPGTFELLEMLKRHNVTMYLASGTDEVFVLEEARLLGVDKYFGEHIYGAQREYKTFSKKMVIDRILRENNLSGEKLVGFGDGYVEIENVREVGGFAVGVPSNESERCGIDEWKRERLIRAGANIIIPDYRNIEELESVLFPNG